MTCPPSARAFRAACFAASVAFATVALVHFHDRQWNGYDDGMYVHVADRVARGEVLNRDVQDMHFGYINFANAYALKWFGDDLVSLRYPLVVMGVANAALAFLLLAGAGTASATAGSVAVTALSYVQFMNPSAHWYVLFLTLLLLAAVAWLPRGSAGRDVCVGFLLGMVVLFRQLSGAFVGAGVLLYLLLELPQQARGRQAWAGRLLAAMPALGLLAYLLKAADPGAFLMYGLWPLAMLAWGCTHLGAANRDAERLVLRLAAGGVLSALPLVAYHVYHGSVQTWLDDTLCAAFSITRLNFIDDLKYWMNMANGARSILRPAGVARPLIGLFWLIGPALPTALGALVLWRLWRSGRRRTDTAADEAGRDGPPVPAVSLVAVFYFLVALHYQKWLYFFFGVPLATLGLLALAPAAGAAFRRVAAAGAVVLSAIAFFLIAAPFPRLLPTPPVPVVRDHGLPRCGIWIPAPTADVLRRICDMTARETAPGETILALPVQPELYYLTGRRNPTRFYNTALGLRSAGDVQSLLQTLERSPPKLVFYFPRNQYVTPECRQVMDWVAQRYDALSPVGNFEVYRHRGGDTGREPAPAPTPAVGYVPQANEEPSKR